MCVLECCQNAVYHTLLYYSVLRRFQPPGVINYVPGISNDSAVADMRVCFGVPPERRPTHIAPPCLYQPPGINGSVSVQ